MGVPSKGDIGLFCVSGVLGLGLGPRVSQNEWYLFGVPYKRIVVLSGLSWGSLFGKLSCLPHRHCM